MLKFLRAGFTRNFLGGFAVGAIGLVALQTSQPPQPPLFPDTTVSQRAS